jgi:hypothetical protein
MSQIFWFPGMRELVDTICELCLLCAEVSGPNKSRRSMGSTMQGLRPGELVVFDYAKLHGTSLLVIMDSFSRFGRFYSTNDPSAEFTAACLYDYFTSYSTPRYLHSDGGGEFVAETIAILRKKSGIHTHFIPLPDNPNSRGRVERTVGIIKTLIVTLVEKLKHPRSHWPDLLSYAQSLYNSRFFQGLGGHPPSDFFLHPLRYDGVLDVIFSERMGSYNTFNPTSLASFVSDTRHAVARNMQDLEQCFSRRESEHIRSAQRFGSNDFSIGDFVLVANKIDDVSKPFLRWSHLSQVVSAKTVYHIEVQDVATQHRAVFHPNRLKLFRLGSVGLSLTEIELARYQQVAEHGVHRLIKTQGRTALVEFLASTPETSPTSAWRTFAWLERRVPHLLLELVENSGGT